MTTFVDTSGWYAAVDAGDAAHASVAKVLDGAGPLVTSDHVLVETWLLVNSRIGVRQAETFLHRCVTGGLPIEIVGRADIEKAVEIGRRYADQGFSLVDRTSFAVMERLGLQAAVTLDDHFAVYRWGPRSRRSFTLLR